MFKSLKNDLPSSLVVFLVALPLCLGISLACGTDPITGIIAGIVGGIVVGTLSGSQLSVSGPAAGLTSIVILAIKDLGSYDSFLLAVVIAGVFQIMLGIVKAGTISDFVPNSVIKGMLAGIGIILILKQIPHFLGDDRDYEGDQDFIQFDNENTFTEIIVAMQNHETGAIILGTVSLALLLLFDRKWFKKQVIFSWVPAPLIVVVIGTVINCLFENTAPQFYLQKDHLVQLPVFSQPLDLFASLPRVNFAAWSDFNVWKTALILALVASLETLLSMEAVDKIDPLKRISPNNRELLAQGTGNIVSGLMGGLPVTAVIVRSSANVNAGAKSKASTIFHGILLLVCVLLIPNVLNLIPKSVLAAVLILIGYKLANVTLFKSYYRKGWDQFVPFLVTAVIVIFNLLYGVLIGLVVGLFYMFRSNFRNAIHFSQDNNNYLLRFKNDVSYLSKPSVKSKLATIPDNSAILIDATRVGFIDKDIIEEVDDFIFNAETRNIRVYIKRANGPMDEIFNDLHRRETNIIFK